MVISTDRKLWAVADALSNDYEINDMCFETSLGQLGKQIKGGLDPSAEHLTLYETQEEALHDANHRLAVLKIQNFLEARREVANHIAEAEDFIPDAAILQEFKVIGSILGGVVTERLEAFVASKK
jgi:hypothetical protein